MKKRDVLIIILVVFFAISIIYKFKPGNIGKTSSDFKKNEIDAFSESVHAFLKITTTSNSGKTIVLPPFPLVGEGELVFTQSDDKLNIISYTSTSVYMKFSTCDGQDCLNQGEVTLANKDQRPLLSSIICLPNKLSIELLTPIEAKIAWEQEQYQYVH